MIDQQHKESCENKIIYPPNLNDVYMPFVFASIQHQKKTEEEVIQSHSLYRSYYEQRAKRDLAKKYSSDLVSNKLAQEGKMRGYEVAWNELFPYHRSISPISPAASTKSPTSSTSSTPSPASADSPALFGIPHSQSASPLVLPRPISRPISLYRGPGTRFDARHYTDETPAGYQPPRRGRGRGNRGRH